MERSLTVTGKELRGFLQRQKDHIYKSQVTVWTHHSGRGLPGTNPVRLTLNWLDPDNHSSRLDTKFTLFVSTEIFGPSQVVVNIRPARES